MERNWIVNQQTPDVNQFRIPICYTPAGSFPLLDLVPERRTSTNNLIPTERSVRTNAGTDGQSKHQRNMTELLQLLFGLNKQRRWSVCWF